MKTKTSFQDNRSGMTLVVVMVMTLLCSAAVASVLYTVGVRMQRAYKQVHMEQAFYIAEAGMERAAAWVATGKEEDKTFTGDVGDGSYETVVTVTNLSGGEIGVEIVSTGTINGTSRTVTVRGLQRVSWARYALWYDRQNLNLVIAAGDVFKGRFYSRPKLKFSNNNLSKAGKAHFYDRAWTVPSSIEWDTGAYPILDQGIVLSAEVQEISSVNLANLKATAETSSNGLLLDGDATIVMDGKNMKITNRMRNWVDHSVPIPDNGLVYARPYKYKVSEYNQAKRRWEDVFYDDPGDILVSAPNGLDGQITLVAENNINIANHVRYKSNPASNPNSDDKLGLIAGKSVIVKPSAPNNVDIYAHIFCRNGGFGVEDYDKKGDRGTMTVYGGIANLIREAVGTSSSSSRTGYLKNYVYDGRFAREPPPYYPRLTDVLAWDGWEG